MLLFFVFRMLKKTYHKDKLVDADRNRSDHDGFQNLVVCIAVGRAYIDDLPFKIYFHQTIAGTKTKSD